MAVSEPLPERILRGHGLPAPKRISIAVASTKGEAGSRVGKGFSEVIFAQIGNYLAPEHPVPLPP
jgi:hypothetical protein